MFNQGHSTLRRPTLVVGATKTLLKGQTLPKVAEDTTGINVLSLLSSVSQVNKFVVFRYAEYGINLIVSSKLFQWFYLR